MINFHSKNEKYPVWKTVKNLIKKLLKAKWRWRLPTQAEVLIFDSRENHPIEHILDEILIEYNIQKYKSPTDEIYLFVLLLGWIFYGIKKTSYQDFFIFVVNPVWVLTYIDNNLSFYSVLNKNQRVKTMFIQNGIRGYYGDIFEILNNQKKKIPMKVDYMMTFGKNVSNEYSKYIIGKTIPIGSFRNNATPVNKIKKKNIISFVSQYRDTIGFYMNKKFYNFKIFWGKPDKLVLRFIEQYAKNNNLMLQILLSSGTDKKTLKKEKDYFKNILNGKCLFLEQTSHCSNYSAIDESLLVVSIDSSLGLEAIARGTKTAIFSIRGTMLQLEKPPFLNYGWPGKYNDTGPFWTNLPRPSIFKQTLDHLLSISQEKWQNEIIESRFSDVLEYNPGNTLLRKVLKSEIIQSKHKKIQNIKNSTRTFAQ